METRALTQSPAVSDSRVMPAELKTVSYWRPAESWPLSVSMAEGKPATPGRNEPEPWPGSTSGRSWEVARTSIPEA